MPNTTLSFTSTSSFRTLLMGKNLPAYTVSGGAFTPPSGPLNYETTINVSSVIDSPDNLIHEDPFAKTLYPLNPYGPEGGYDINITYNGPINPITPNQGPYAPIDSSVLSTKDLYLNELVTSPGVKNTFIPQGGYDYIYNVGETQNNNSLFLPYGLTTFVPSTYSTYEIVTSDNPNGDNGPLSNDSFLAKIGAKQLTYLYQERVNAEIYQNSVGLVNLDSLSDPFEASLIATGKEPLVYRNWAITVPESPVTRVFDLATRLSGAYWPVSFIPGDYFDENTKGGQQTQQTSKALNVINQLTGGFLGPILNIKRNPSQIFLSNTGNGQRSVLFNNLDYNKYQPAYTKDFGGLIGVGQAIVNLAVSLINPNGTLSSSYYVGSNIAEPSTITSPPNQVPINAYGQQVPSPVYGPSELGILFEGNQESFKFGFAGNSLTDGGGIDGGLIWTSKKYKSEAGYKAGPGGDKGSSDEDFNQISSQYSQNESTNIEFRENSILDNTQRLIDSADGVVGIARFKHVGTAINQVSKVFNDGYKEMTKGSQVVSYKDDTTGGEKGIEYCRVFTKDTPYYTFNDLQKTDGITKSGRRFTNSVLDNTYNLNISPLKGKDSTNIISNNDLGLGGYAKKYMFSIENLAWRTSSRPGYTYDELPVCEKGPNGGRVMWFPPYDLQFSDSSTANWNPTTFLGRPEPIYTYKETSRTGQLSWKIIVDHPSVMNTIVEKQLSGQSKERINSIIDSFFAGCVKFDIYKLAIKFNTIPTKDLYTYQEILSNPRLTDVETLNQINKQIPKDNSDNTGSGAANVTSNTSEVVSQDNSVANFENDYLDFAFYFDNDIPGKAGSSVANESFSKSYSDYISKKEFYKTSAASAFKEGNINRNVESFFTTVIESNYNKFAGGTKNFVTDAYDIISKGLGKIKISLQGSASAVATPAYNKQLSERRIDSITKFLKQITVGDKNLAKYFEDGSITIENSTGSGEEIVIPITSVEIGSDGKQIETPDSGTAESVDCKKNLTPDFPKVKKSVYEVYAVNAMACRRVKVKGITVVKTPTPTPTPIKDPEVVLPTETNGATQTVPVKRPEPQKSIEQKIKEGISKKILRNLLSECDYFDMIKQNVPMVYDSFKEKIKYFNPAFHSMTPEGLNSRLTFLNQCLRPGETIPIILDKKISVSDAVNTSFGAPPVLVLRIGDFYHTKIIPETLSITYEPLLLDMNPEGIGVQPMLAKVSLSFKIIGGMGLAKPVEQLQNALSFNYYGNTEIYDDRATWTEDTSKLDKQVVEGILASQPPVTVNNVGAGQQTNDAGSLIGEIKTTTPLTPSGETGEISYMKIMDKFVDDSKNYFNGTFNSLSEIVKQTNYGILQMISAERDFSKGTISNGTNNADAEIFGKPIDVKKKLDSFFELVVNDIDSNTNPIMAYLVAEKFNDPNLISVLHKNLKRYVLRVKDEMTNTLNGIINNKLGQQQVDYVQDIRKINLICSLTDGKILDDGTTKLYNLSGSDKTSPPENNVVFADTYAELKSDYFKSYVILNDYIGLLKNLKVIPAVDTVVGSFTPLYKKFKTGREYKTFFMVMGRIFTDKNKVKEFVDSILTQNIESVTKPANLKRKFNKIVDDLVSEYRDEIKEEDKLFEKASKDSKFLGYTDGIDEKFYKKGKSRIFNFTTIPNQVTEAQQQTNLNNLYKGDSSLAGNKKTFDGKIKFN